MSKMPSKGISFPKIRPPVQEPKYTRDPTNLTLAATTKKPIFQADADEAADQYSIVAAIDIGTSYSGYAYCHRRDGKGIVQNIVMNPPWMTSDKSKTTLRTPSCLLLNEKKEFQAFGYEAERLYLEAVKEGKHNRVLFFRHFKAKLHGVKDLRCNSLITDENGHTFSALKVFAFTIRYLKSQLLNSLCLRGNDVGDNYIRWVITVPAMWPELSKQFMRKAAETAGIPGEMLKLCLEPEAASIFCQNVPSSKLKDKLPIMKSGSRYILADLGGGLTDIVLHEKRKDGMREISRGGGAKIGSTAVDNIFIQFLFKLFGDKIMTEFMSRYKKEFLLLMRDFDEQKRLITPKTTSSIELRLPSCLQLLCQKEQYNDNLENLVFRSVYKGKVRIVQQRMSIDAVIGNEFFRAISLEMAKLIQHYLKLVKTAADVTVLVLSGACAQSEVVQEYIHNTIVGKTQIKHMIVPPETDVAVLKGAVLFGHNPESIFSRVNRFTTGLRIARLYNPEMHQESRRSTLQGVEYVFDIFSPFLTIGTRVPSGFVSHQALTSTEPNQKKIDIDVYVSTKLGHNFTNDEGSERMGKIEYMIPEPSEEGRSVYIDFILGDTEMVLYVIDKKTKIKSKYFFPPLLEK